MQVIEFRDYTNAVLFRGNKTVREIVREVNIRRARTEELWRRNPSAARLVGRLDLIADENTQDKRPGASAFSLRIKEVKDLARSEQQDA